MLSEKQLIANRNNCLKSTGPCTLEGKNIASRNAVRHGLLSNSDEILIKGENQDEFDSFRQNLLANLDPQGQLEVLLVERITGFFWKLKRAGRMEKGLLNILCNPSSDSDLLAKKNSLPFTMITTKTYLNPSEDPEYQEFKKLKQQQAVACGFDPSDNKIIDPETFQSIPGLHRTETEVSPVMDGTSAEAMGRAVRHDFQNGGLLERLLRYEGQIERSLYRALTELQKFQFLRKRNEAISSVDEASVLHDNNDQNMLTGDADCPKSISAKSVQSVVSVSPEAEKPNEAILTSAQAVLPNKAILPDNVAEASLLQNHSTADEEAISLPESAFSTDNKKPITNGQ